MTTRTVIIAGATGLVGREILRRLLADRAVQAVHALVRRPLGIEHARLTQYPVDFTRLPKMPAASEAYLALGTTIKVAGSQAAFRAVDFDANLAVARAARAAGVARIGLVSAMGASAASPVFYNRVKGELEDALAALAFEGLVIARPSFLAGNRESLGQPVRGGETIALRVSQLLRPLIPDNYRSVLAEDVAAALVRHVPQARGRRVLLSGEMQGASEAAPSSGA